MGYGPRKIRESGPAGEKQARDVQSPHRLRPGRWIRGAGYFRKKKRRGAAAADLCGTPPFATGRKNTPVALPAGKYRHPARTSKPGLNRAASRLRLRVTGRRARRPGAGKRRMGYFAFLVAASTMAAKSWGFREAPPIRPPSTSGWASSSAALPAFMEPPY